MLESFHMADHEQKASEEKTQEPLGEPTVTMDLPNASETAKGQNATERPMARFFRREENRAFQTETAGRFLVPYLTESKATASLPPDDRFNVRMIELNKGFLESKRRMEEANMQYHELRSLLSPETQKSLPYNLLMKGQAVGEGMGDEKIGGRFQILIERAVEDTAKLQPNRWSEDDIAGFVTRASGLAEAVVQMNDAMKQIQSLQEELKKAEEQRLSGVAQDLAAADEQAQEKRTA